MANVKVCIGVNWIDPDIVSDALEQVRQFDDFRVTEHDPFVIHIGGEFKNEKAIVSWNLYFRDKETGLAMIPDRYEDPTKMVEFEDDENIQDYAVNTLELIISKPAKKTQEYS